MHTRKKDVIDPAEIVKKFRRKEVDFEIRFKRHVLAAGGVYLKYTSIGDTSWPDRLLMLPGGVSWWIEFKRPGEKKIRAKKGIPEPLQEIRAQWLKDNGHNYALLDTEEKINTFIRYELQYYITRSAVKSFREKDKQSKKVNKTSKYE